MTTNFRTFLVHNSKHFSSSIFPATLESLEILSFAIQKTVVGRPTEITKPWLFFKTSRHHPKIFLEHHEEIFLKRHVNKFFWKLIVILFLQTSLKILSHSLSKQIIWKHSVKSFLNHDVNWFFSWKNFSIFFFQVTNPYAYKITD